MILVTGATGNVGGALLAQLAQRGVATRALVRRPERADTLRGYDVDIAVGDYDDPASLPKALDGVERVFVAAPASEVLASQEGAMLDAAAAAGVSQVVLLTAAGVDAPGPSPVRLLRGHQAVVRRAGELDLPATVLAPNGFMQNFLRNAGQAQAEGVLAGPLGAAAVSYVDVRDVAAVAAHVLTSDGHEGATYTITGPEALTMEQVAERMSAVAEREVRYVDVPVDDARAGMLASGAPPWLTEGLIELYDVYKAGHAAAVTDEVQKATGHPARSLDTFLGDHRAAFRA